MELLEATKSFSSQTKTEATCTSLEDMAKQAGPGGRLPTVQVLCESLNISRVTLDRAMSQLARRGVIVRKPGQGTFAAPPQVKAVGVLFGLDPFRIACSPFYHLLFDAIRQELSGRNLEMETYVDPAHAVNHQRVRQRLENDIAAGQIQGLLLPVSGRKLWEWAYQQDVALVSGWARWMSSYCVGFDWQRMIDGCVGELARRGCKHIGLVSHPLSLQVMRASGDAERRFFEQSMLRRGLAVDSRWIYQISLPADEFPETIAPSYEEDGYELGKKLAGNPSQLPDGLIISDDMVARGLLTALSRAGIYPGQQIEVATHLNLGSTALVGFEQDLVRAEVNPAEIASAMVHMLDTLMAGKAPAKSRVLIPPVRIVAKARSI